MDKKQSNSLKKLRNQLIAILNSMNGHDFIEVLFHYINKIKNTANFKIENFEKVVYVAIQPDYFY